MNSSSTSSLTWFKEMCWERRWGWGHAQMLVAFAPMIFVRFAALFRRIWHAFQLQMRTVLLANVDDIWLVHVLMTGSHHP